jgi:hypothetical protein
MITFATARFWRAVRKLIFVLGEVCVCTRPRTLWPGSTEFSSVPYADVKRTLRVPRKDTFRQHRSLR